MILIFQLIYILRNTLYRISYDIHLISVSMFRFIYELKGKKRNKNNEGLDNLHIILLIHVYT